MNKYFKKNFKLFKKYLPYTGIILIIAPNILEPEWLVRLVAVAVICWIFLAIIGKTIVRRFVLKWSIEESVAGKEKAAKLNKSQRKWTRVLIYPIFFLMVLVLTYCMHFFFVDLARFVFTDQSIQKAEVTVTDRSQYAGFWFIGQSLEIEEENISGGDLFLMFHSKHALVGRKYEVMYLPYSGLILEMEELP